MNINEINERLKELDIEDFIWIIYIGIIALSFYSNHLERKYFLTNNNKDKEKYRNILIFIFIILVIVYIYYLYDSYQSLKNLDKNASEQTKNLTYLAFIASFLIAISGFIYLFIAVKDKDINVELAFN